MEARMAKEKNPNELKEYILKPGYTHNGFKGEGDERTRHLYDGNDPENNRVFLREDQARAFGDRFESAEDRKERLKAQEESQRLRREQQKIAEALAERGITLDELLNPETAKKPTPPAGAAEPTPATTTPAPVGSTPNPASPNPKQAEKGIVPPNVDKK
jgi:hypothetical protein